MKATVLKESDQVFLSIDDIAVDESDYSLKMLKSCPMDSLLPSGIFFCNGNNRLRYDITGLIPFTDRYRSLTLKSPDIRALLYTLRDTCLRLPDYLLDSQDLLLDPEDIFMSPGGNQIMFCYVPGLGKTDSSTTRLLAQFLIKHVDHTDRNASALAYDFYDKAAADSSILPLILRDILDDPQNDSSATAPDSFSYSQRPSPQPAGNSPPPRPSSGQFSGSRQMRRERPSPRQIPKAVRRKQTRDRQILIMLITIAIASGGLIAYLFRMDAAQIGGIAFLSASLIWLFRQHQYKKGGDLKNIWSDEEEEMEDDDTFYKSLLNEVYAQGTDSRPSPEDPPHAEDEAGKDTAGPAPLLLQSLEPSRYASIPLERSVIVIGKNPHDCDICLKSDTVSRIHAKIEKVGDTYYLTDLFSTNGTFINGKRLQPNHAVALSPLCEISFADCHFKAP